MIQGKKKDNGLFVIGMLFFAFSSIFAISGYAHSLSYNDLATFAAFVALITFVLLVNQDKSKFNSADFLLTATLFMYFILCVFSWKSFSQITNLITVFCMLLWVKLFSTITWDRKKYAAVGIAMSIYSLIMIFSFLPGRFLSGWNTNSAICIMPSLIFALACLELSGTKWKTQAILLVGAIAIYLLMQLENRSAFLALILFLIVSFFKKLHRSKIAFRVLYISIIALNILLPMFFELATEWKLFNVISDWLKELFDKSGLNGREEVWATALKYIEMDPWVGTIGHRTEYAHNFSLDILTQFGWIGWIVYFSCLVYILEHCFEENSPKNLFLLGFLALIFLNTFESVLFCNNYLILFPYLLLAICWKPFGSKTRIREN